MSSAFNRRNILKALLIFTIGTQGILTFYLLKTDSVQYSDIKLMVSSLVLFAISLTFLKLLKLKYNQLKGTILVAMIFLQICAMTSPPSTSDDDFRYYFDGKVQMHGINPYRYAPSDAKLTSLRDSFVFTKDRPCPYHFFESRQCFKINRPRVNTIYPPVSQVVFSGLYLTTLPAGPSHIPYQIAGAIGSLLIILILFKKLRSNNQNLWASALFAWCPITIIEFSNNAHIDWLGVIFILLALVASTEKKYVRTGIFIGLAFCSKFYPAIIAPALVKRNFVTVFFSTIACIISAYFFYALSIGTKVFGFLPGYLEEEKYVSGERFLLINRVFNETSAAIIAGLIVGASMLWAIFKTNPLTPEKSAVTILGIATLCTTPAQGWYSLLLLSLIVLSKYYYWIPMAIVPTSVYIAHQSFGTHGNIALYLYLTASIFTLSWFVFEKFRTSQVPKHALERTL